MTDLRTMKNPDVLQERVWYTVGRLVGANADTHENIYEYRSRGWFTKWTRSMCDAKPMPRSEAIAEALGDNLLEVIRVKAFTKIG